MKKILFILLSIISISAYSQPIGRLPYYMLKQTYAGDTINYYFSADSFKFLTNQPFFIFNKQIKAPLFLQGADTLSTRSYVRGLVIPNVGISWGDTLRPSGKIATPFLADSLANSKSRLAGNPNIGYLKYNGITALSGAFSGGNSSSLTNATDTLSYSGLFVSRGLNKSIYAQCYGNEGDAAIDAYVGTNANAISGYSVSGIGGNFNSEGYIGVSTASEDSLGLFCQSINGKSAIFSTAYNKKIVSFQKHYESALKQEVAYIDTFGGASFLNGDLTIGIGRPSGLGFYMFTGSDYPTGSNTLYLNGYLGAKGIYSDVNSSDYYYLDASGTGIYTYNYGIFDLKYNNIYIRNYLNQNAQVNGNSLISSNMAHFEFSPKSQVGYTNNITGEILKITDNPSNIGTQNYKIFSAVVKSGVSTVERIRFDPRCKSSDSTAYIFDTNKQLDSNDTIFNIKNFGNKKSSILYDGSYVTNGRIGIGTFTPKHVLSVLSNTVMGDSVFNFVDTDRNKQRRNAKEATDTSSFSLSFTKNTDKPVIKLTTNIGDTAFYIDSTSYVKFKVPTASGFVEQASYTPNYTQNVYLKLTPGFTTTKAVGFTIQGDTVKLTADAPGYYDVFVWSTHADANNTTYILKLYKNNSTTEVNGSKTILTTGAGLWLSMDYYWLVKLVKNDVLSFRMANITSNNDLTTRDFKFLIRYAPSL